MKINAIVRIVIYGLILLILGSILCGFLFLREYRFAPAVRTEPVLMETWPVSQEEIPSFPADRITDLEIQWVAGDIRILPNEDIAEIRVCEDAVPDPKYQMHCGVSGKTLSIQFSEDTHIAIGFGIHSDDFISKDLTIEVPAGWVCGELEVDAAASNLEVEDLTIREVNYNGASGVCDFRNCQIEDLDLDTASGDVTFDGSLTTLDFDAASASFTGRFRNVPSRIDMDSMSGNLDITLPDNCGYSLSMDGMSSSFHSDFQGTELRNGIYVYGDGQCKITVDGVSCDVTVRKANTF